MKQYSLKILVQGHGILTQPCNIKTIIAREFTSEIGRIVIRYRTKPARAILPVPSAGKP